MYVSKAPKYGRIRERARVSYVIDYRLFQLVPSFLLTSTCDIDFLSIAMILRYLTSQPLPLHLFSLLLLLSSAVHVTAQSFDCRSVLAEELSWDLMSLSGVHTVRRTRDSPPTTMVDELRFNLCEDLTSLEDVAEGDQASLPLNPWYERF
jgi:hypothetical protein